MASTARSRVRESAGNIPADATSFVGRRHEITLTKRLLAESRLVTLTGPGGVGKTRLAMRVASNLRRTFRDKAWPIELEELGAGSLLTDAVTEQLGLGGASSKDDLDAIVEQLRNREMLLVLDNCEHVVEEAARFADAVIKWCPGVRILATSTRSLGLAGESTMVVPPLQVPDVEHLPPPEAYEQYASVRLFIDRAKAAIPEFEVNAHDGTTLMRLCSHLDGNPLAIELAAVRLRSLSLQQLEARLAETYDLLTEGRRGAPARQRTLRALIEWSWDLCSEQDRLAWARVSLFSGSFDLRTAEYVAGNGLSGPDMDGTMHSLVDKSVLLRQEVSGEVRFRLLHALREYGQEKLQELGERQRIEQRYCDWYAGLVETFATEWLGPEQVSWVERLRHDQGNLRVALLMLVAEPSSAPRGLRMVTNLGPYWGIRGLTGEGRHWIDEALQPTRSSAPERIPALRVKGWFALLQGDVATAKQTFDEATVLAGQLGDEFEKAYLVQTRGMTALLLGEWNEAIALLEDALERFRTRQVLAGELFALFGLGMAKGLGQDVESGLAMLERCLEITSNLGELYWRSYALWAVSFVEIARSELQRAESAAKDALGLQRQLDNKLAMAFTIDSLAWIAQRQGRYERSARLFGAAAAVWDAVRAAPSFYAPFQTERAKHEERTRAALGDNAYQDAFERGYELSFTATADYALEVKKHAQGPSRSNVHPMPLTKREREIAHLVAQGRTNKEIAESLVIAQRTVEGHVQNILTKLDFSSRAQVAGWIAGQQSSSSAETEP